MAFSCRTCLQTGQTMKDLFSKNYNPTLVEMLMSSTQLEANPLDGRPRVICINCMDKLFMSYMFKKMCHESEVILKKHFLDNISKEQSQISGDVQDRSSDNSTKTNYFTTTMSVTNIAASVTSELHNTCDLNTETLEYQSATGENTRDVDANNRNGSPNDVTASVIKKASLMEKKYDCPKCSGKFHDMIQYQNHRCDKVRFKCTKCIKNYASQVRLDHHMKEIHEKESNNPSVVVTTLVSGLLEIEYVPEANQNPNIKQETADSVRDDYCEIVDDVTFSPGIDDEVNDVESTNVIYMKDSPLNMICQAEEEQLHCKHCLKTFQTRLLLVNHMAKKHGIGKKMYGCRICHEIFPSYHIYSQHQDANHRDSSEPFTCNDCGKEFPYRSSLHQHIKRVHTNVRCHWRVCPKLFSTKEKATEHMSTCEFSTRGPKTIRKNIISTKAKPTQPKFKDLHKRFVDKTRFICDYCNKEFKKRRNIQSHIKRLHMGSPPDRIQCNECHMAFNTLYAKNLHVKIHRPACVPRRHLCSECGKEFKRLEELRYHLAWHRGDRQFKCQYCDKAFVRPTDRRAHERYHTDTRNHFCTICGKGFFRTYSLKMHIRTHTGEKPHKCTFCDWRCARADDLKIHIRRHTGERDICEICNEAFILGYMLKNHKLSAHGIYDPKLGARIKKVSLPAVSSEVAKQSELDTN